LLRALFAANACCGIHHHIFKLIGESAKDLPNQHVLYTLALDTGVKIGRLNTVEGLTLDEVRRGNGYVNVMRRNVKALVKGYHCRDKSW
jgi:ABC-type Zn uptake system ZnuABC Zn-binding protein ZnuA